MEGKLSIYLVFIFYIIAIIAIQTIAVLSFVDVIRYSILEEWLRIKTSTSFIHVF